MLTQTDRAGGVRSALARIEWPPSARVRQHSLQLAVAGLAGLSFWLIFRQFAPLSKADTSYRDDAVITLSYAKNLIDYGAIASDPAGARVEGFSTPLQFWLFAAVYAVTRSGYAAFLDWQVGICTFLLGCALYQLFRPHVWLGLLSSVALAFWLTHCVRFFGWHHSGMENALMHVLFVGLLAGCARSLEQRRVSSGLLLCALLASLVRLESIVHVAPLLAIWSIAYAHEHRDFAAVRGSALVLGGWLLYQLFRLNYFGSLQPNTARAEDVDVLLALRGIARGNLPNAAAALDAVRRIASEHRVYMALAAIPLLAFGRRSPRRTLLITMLASLTLTSLGHPLLFGPARLDPVRTTSHVALVAPLLIATQWLALPRWSVRVASAAAVAALLALCVRVEPPADTSFCCPIRRADPIAKTCLAHARSERLAHPSLANPDLGRISFRKDFLLFDLGWIGSPPLAVLRRDPSHTADYLLGFAAPDFIELHGGWVCEYRQLFHDARFRDGYSLLPTSHRLGLSTGCPGRAGIWFRKAMRKDAGTPERRLYDDLQARLDPARVAEELRSCERQQDRLACLYVARTVYRFIPELIRSGLYEQVVQLFRSDRSRAYSVNLLTARSRGLWHEPVVKFVREN